MEFFGKKEALAGFLSIRTPHYYVYILHRPDGTPFYVGKGTRRRVFEHELEALRHHPVGENNPFKCNVIRKIYRQGGDILYGIDSVYYSEGEQECLLRERELISKYKRFHEGGSLANLAGGLGSTSGAAPFSLERHAATLSGAPKDNTKRAILNVFLQTIGPVQSVPIKPIDQISRILPSTPHPNPRKPTVRSAYALVSSAIAHGLTFAAKVRIPRVFIYEGVTAIIENGVSRDLLKSELASLVPATNPADEAYVMSAEQVTLLSHLVGRSLLERHGVL